MVHQRKAHYNRGRPQRIPAVETAELKELVRVGDTLHGRLMIISAFQLAEILYNCGLF
jgi:hypothetical protein